jgi:hypothetical protein
MDRAAHNIRKMAKEILLEKIGTTPAMVEFAEKYESQVFEYVGKVDDKYFSMLNSMKTLCS